MGYIEKIEGNNSLKAGVGMNVNELKKIIESGEKINVEFKLSENDLTKDVYQSVCSFNNRNGGHIILGVVDQTKEIRGVNPQKTDKMLKDFTTSALSVISISPSCVLSHIRPFNRLSCVPSGTQI